MKKKRFIALIFSIISIFAMVGCEKETSSIETESKFNIVFPEEEIREYIEKARENEEDIDKLYEEIIYEPIRVGFREGTSYTDDHIPRVQYSIKNLDKLENQLEIFIESDIVQIAKEALDKCDDVLFSGGTTVYIMSFDPNNIYFPIGPVEGITSTNGKILVEVNPMIGDWETLFPHIIAHEYHHSVSMDKDKERVFTMLDALLFEGRADLFANIVYPDLETSWTSLLPIIREKEIWNKIKENLNSVDYKYQREIMFGGVKGIPTNCGYKIGYNIMQEFIKNNPDVSVEEWTGMKAEEIFEKSGYEESLEKRLKEYNN
ncbi:DUF2268 domain-containing putative Zn-dependent protease [Tissierella sp. MB52-C2]|uniref:DUF2268 domain-containing protein n=1 Tax=Tissierella sp. MB52-C2 TaxID=3070999 RepID=UPI00280B524F|nr:DUF2268 domain-containing putative Zn-dependent protease [Tissierella sp. MB52-C2]WMM24467.1 DUF2268 domain-containing putative Zn-dependent protease [Tissierella sp. MB52-C2]